MESDAVTRYRSRILREMKANRENPFNSPPSSTGRASPTLSSVFSDPEGESTRRLQEDIARVAAPRKLPINWDAARRKWPEFYSQPKQQTRPLFDDHTDTTPLAEIPHLNTDRKPAPPATKYIDDTTEDAWNGSKRTRAEMQPRVENDPDLSQIASRPPVIRGLSTYGLNYAAPHNPSPLSKILNQSSPREEAAEKQRQMSVEEALDKIRRASSNPREDDRRVSSHNQSSPNMSSAKSSLTAVPSSPLIASPERDTPNAHRSLLMPDISHLDDFLTGTLKFDGQVKNGVPVLVKHGQVHDQKVQPFGVRYAEVDGIKLPEEEEKIFVSIDMIRDEILSLREQHQKLQEYSATLENEVQRHKSRRNTDGGLNVFNANANEQLLAKKNELEAEVASLQRRLDQAARRISTGHQENDTLTQERDRVINRLQEACEDISKLTRKLNTTEKQLENTHKQLGSTEQIRQDNDALRRDVTALKQDNEALREEVETLRRELQHFRQEAQSLRTDGKGLRQDQQTLASENRTLRTNNKTLMDENEDLQDNLDGIQHELDAAREENEALRRELQSLKQKQATLREDNANLVRQNEKYFSENKILRRENAGFEHSVHDLHDRNLKLKEEIEALKRQLDHYRPAGKSEPTRQDGETEENMTSAFFVPDITLKSNDDATDTKDMPDTDDLATGAHESGRRESRTTQKREATGEKADGRHRSRSSVRSSPSKNSGTAQKVAFALPDKAADKSTQGSKSTVANQGSKRRSRLSVPEMDPYGDEDTTGLLSMDNISQDLAISLNLDHKDATMGKEAKQARSSSGAKSAPKIVHIESKSQPSKKTVFVGETGVRTVRIGERDVCPALSNNARRILDDLCGHNCQNCTVCSRITAHSGVISSTDVAAGKKRVSIPRPVPVSDRGASGGDHTVRPAHSPGYALALVIKGLEDESQHIQLELTRLQARYNKSDKSMGRRERQALSDAIHQLLKRVEAKNDQIYSLYDVLEGQKAAGQEMTDEQVEMTVLNITGMTVRDVTSASDLTWEGLVEA
ncbi:hypothetical protein BBK36DRAFT_1160115 [Trichoderma citrinoviride]|uniref:Cep57 centrosome microtubule-binding domain-containing protein n=1 Tax=Trichoderma citrinoviride TaxID=58853 RepID=A0A2T4B9K8_9HYPO|nr:hypothetical protein BBK36DRAFT_1160115 [Trichoderma citrinoviride]PTB66000.1 hypothetical protein BBK36DRAFT_1160115 [Trichoderma citrinoviride]